MHHSTLEYLKNIGMEVWRAGERVYRGKMSNFEEVDVLFQNANEIPRMIVQGDADLGVTGLDIITERFWDRQIPLDVFYPDLKYGRAGLVLAVPVEWYDIKSFEDLRYLAEDWYAHGRKLQIATKFPHLTSSFLRERHLWNFEIQHSVGSTELAPEMGFSDIIADLSSTGKTLEANRLKELEGCVIFKSQACLVGNGGNILKSQEKRDFLSYLLHRTEALHASKKVKKLFFTMKKSHVKKFCKIIEALGVPSHSQQTVGTDESQISVILKEERLESLLRETHDMDIRDVRAEDVSYLLAADRSRTMEIFRLLKRKYPEK